MQTPAYTFVILVFLVLHGFVDAASAETLAWRVMQVFDLDPVPPETITPKGPEEIPERLDGIWRVSLYVKPGYGTGHGWIRYENVHTGDVHTIGRFRKGIPPVQDPETGELRLPGTTVTGLHWDYDLRFEHEIGDGKYHIQSVLVRDPVVFRGSGLYGHGFVRNNCITYVRDAWDFYAGQKIDLPAIHLPNLFLGEIEKLAHVPHDPAARPDARHDYLTDGADVATHAPNRLPPVQMALHLKN